MNIWDMLLGIAFGWCLLVGITMSIFHLKGDRSPKLCRLFCVAFFRYLDPATPAEKYRTHAGHIALAFLPASAVFGVLFLI